MKRKSTIRQPVSPYSGMYIFVFTTRTSFLLAFLLLLSILLQPIKTVFADTSSSLVSAEIEVVDEVLSVDSEVDTGTTNLPDDTSLSPSQIDTETEVETEIADEIVDLVVPETVNNDTAEEVEMATSTVVIEDESEFEIATSGFESASQMEGGAAPTSTTTSENEVTVTAVSYGDSVVQFDKDSCVSVSDGSFYCQNETALDTTRADGVYALPDKDGDLEIFIQAGADLTQLTFNTDDDSSPYFDSESNTMVWHRLINDRYQIISYDVESGTEIQLTDDNVNNMEPTRSGKLTVWQHWDNNWEVVLYDGVNKRQLTHSVEHDISPSIRNGLVVWYKLTEGTEKSIQLYNTKTAEFTTIEDDDGGTISNPRMVVVYETTYENGDVVTKGYDLVTGEIISLDSVPAELPDTLPNPDATGETRALLQAKSTTKEDGDAEQTTPTSEPPPPTIGEFDLVIGSTSASSSFETETVFNTTATATVVSADYTLDLSIPKNIETGVEFEIEDVVIQNMPAVASTSATEPDSN